jgi:glycosyltransferase involved in cell wall biosynthesis
MLRVLAIGSSFDLSEVYLFAGLKEQGVGVEAVLGADSRLAEKLEQLGIPCRRMDLKSRVDLPAILKLRKIIKLGEFDILHCLTARAVSNVLIASAGLNRKIKIVAYRGVTHRDSKFSPASWFSFLNPGVDKIICLSDAVREFMAGVVRPSKLARVYKGFDVNWYLPKRMVKLEEFGIPSGAFVAACVASMRVGKGIPYLLSALRYFSPDSPIHLLLIGDLARSVDVSGLADPSVAVRVHFAGFQTDVGSILSRCHAFIMASEKREGLCKAVIEAMSVGLPTIVTRIGGMPEVVTDGLSGLVIEPRSSSAIYEAISRLMENPALAKELGQAGRKTIIEKFSVARAVRETLAVYEGLFRPPLDP